MPASRPQKPSPQDAVGLLLARLPRSAVVGLGRDLAPGGIAGGGRADLERALSAARPKRRHEALLDVARRFGLLHDLVADALGTYDAVALREAALLGLDGLVVQAGELAASCATEETREAIDKLWADIDIVRDILAYRAAGGVLPSAQYLSHTQPEAERVLRRVARIALGVKRSPTSAVRARGAFDLIRRHGPIWSWATSTLPDTAHDGVAGAHLTAEILRLNLDTVKRGGRVLRLVRLDPTLEDDLGTRRWLVAHWALQHLGRVQPGVWETRVLRAPAVEEVSRASFVVGPAEGRVESRRSGLSIEFGEADSPIVTDDWRRADELDAYLGAA